MNLEYKNLNTWNDKWIAEEVFPGTREGFYVEAGACNGVGCSSTYVLEKELGWKGVLVEPDPIFFGG